MPASTILLAEDDRAIRTVLSQALSAWATRSAPRATPPPCGAGSPRARATSSSPTWSCRTRTRSTCCRASAPCGPTCRDRDERAEHAAHRRPGGRARRVRIPAQAVRHTELVNVVERALSAPQPIALNRPRRRRRADTRGAAADHRPLAGDAGDLPGHRPADGHRPDRPDHRRVRHRQGTGRPGPARFRQAPQRARSSRSTWRRSRAS